MISRLLPSVFIFGFFIVSNGYAQSQPAGSGEKATASNPSMDQSHTIQEQQMDAVIERIEAAESEIENQKAHNAQLQKENTQLQEKVEELENRMNESDEAAMASLMDEVEEGFEPRLDLYGFMDFVLFYYDIDEHDSNVMQLPSNYSFFMNHLNLYFSAQMERTLSALAEIRYSFLPNGNEESYNIDVLGLEYKRSHTEADEWFNYAPVTAHSLTIERALFTWKPSDLFGVTFGRFITPYGIWVTDHAPTVTIPARLPLLMTRNIIPISQTGVELFGRVFPLTNIYFDYALTLSNGKGPAEALYDVDDNKALGLRLKTTFRTEDFKASLGTYIYWGLYTNIVKSVETDFVSSRATRDVTERYEELTASLDFIIQIYGLRLQAEGFRAPRKYSVRPKPVYAVIDIVDPRDVYVPDSVSWYAYALVAYSIPLQIVGQEMELTPYALYEYDKENSYHPRVEQKGIRGGLNFKPSPFLVVKFESIYQDHSSEASGDVGGANDLNSKYWIHSTQVAISF